MNKRLLGRFIPGSVALARAISEGLIYGRYQHELSLAYQRISRGGRTIETACGPIQYTEFGEGAPMLIVHGAGGGYDQGEYFARLIGGRYHWVAPSRFGFLGSPVPKGADSAQQADAYACLLDALGIDMVGVVGVSRFRSSSRPRKWHNLDPDLIPLVLASLGGVHFLPYAWLQRSHVYIYLAVAVSIGAYAIQIILPSNEFTVILFYVALLYWAGAILVYRTAARLVAAL